MEERGLPGRSRSKPPADSDCSFSHSPHHLYYSGSQTPGCPSAVRLPLQVWRPVPLCSGVMPVTLSRDHISFSVLHCGLLQCVAASGRDGSSVTLQHVVWVSPAQRGTAQGGSGQTFPLPVPLWDAQHHMWYLLQQEGNTKKASLKGTSLKVNRQVRHRAEHRAWGRGRVKL